MSAPGAMESMQADDDGMVTVPLEEPAPPTDAPAAKPAGPPEADNLVEFLSEAQQHAISTRVHTDFYADIDSRSKHMARLKRWDELYSSVMRAKTWPFDKAANVNIPMLNTGVLQIQGRLYDMILPAKGELFHSMPMDQRPDELDRANRTEMYLNFLARHEIPGFTQIYDELLFQMCIYGSAFMSYMWSETEGCIQPECISAEDMVVPYEAKSKDPRMKGVPRYTRVRWMSYYDLIEKGAEGYFSNTEDITPSDGMDVDSESREVADEISGMEKSPNATVEDQDRQILEMHIRWLKLPAAPNAHPSLDGRPHAVIAWVDSETQKLLRLVVREEADPKDKIRFDKETAAVDAHTQQLAAFVAANGTQVDPSTGQLIAMPQPPPAPPHPKPARVREVTFFTHYRAFPCKGFYGMGFGDIIGPLNEAANTVVNQSIDRGTVNNAGGGFVSRQLRFNRGAVIQQPGLYIEVDAPPAAMKDGLQPRPMIPADPEMMALSERIEQWGQRASGSGDTLSGEPIGSNETARGSVLRHEEANKQISVLGSRVIAYMKNDVDMIWRLLSVFLPENDTTSVPNKDGNPTSIAISRADFIADQRVFPAADPRVTSRAQRIDEAEGALQMAMANPQLASNPQIVHALTENVLHARDMAYLIPMMTPPAPPPPPPVPQTTENADFLQGKQPQVNPQDNHRQHLTEMAVFKTSPEYQAMTPEQQQAFEQHGRNHIGEAMKQEQQNGQAPAPNVPGSAGPGAPGMGGPPGNAPAPAGPGGSPPAHAGPVGPGVHPGQAA